MNFRCSSSSVGLVSESMESLGEKNSLDDDGAVAIVFALFTVARWSVRSFGKNGESLWTGIIRNSRKKRLSFAKSRFALLICSIYKMNDNLKGKQQRRESYDTIINSESYQYLHCTHKLWLFLEEYLTWPNHVVWEFPTVVGFFLKLRYDSLSHIFCSFDSRTKTFPRKTFPVPWLAWTILSQDNFFEIFEVKTFKG